MAEQSNILILLHQEHIPLALSFCPPLLLKSLLIIGPLKTKLHGIKGLLRAVAKENNRGSITSVQKAGRASERAKKRVAEEQARENGAREGGESGDQVEGRAPKRARVAIGAPRRSRRHV